MSKTGTLILLRHGQSLWNVTVPTENLVARFTGWCDVGLAPRGRTQAAAAGRAIRDILPHRSHPKIDVAFCSLLERARDTLDLSLREIGIFGRIPVVSSFRLNERHYGGLIGMSKVGAERIHGVEVLNRWRNGWYDRPPPMDTEQMNLLESTSRNHPIVHGHDSDCVAEETGNLDVFEVNFASKMPELASAPPSSESLGDAYRRVLPLWTEGIVPRLKNGQTVLVSSHANTIRCLLSHIDPTIVGRNNLKEIKIPSAVPLVYQFQNRQENGKEALSLVSRANVLHWISQKGGALKHKNEESNNLILERMMLNGVWLETEEINELSFCTSIGEKNLEQEIA